MGFDIVLEDERGKRIDGVGDPTNLLHGLLPRLEENTFKCLNFVDWYGDTSFNRLQMDSLLAELDRLQARAASEDGEELLARIADLARRCQRGRHLYLKFYGD